MKKAFEIANEMMAEFSQDLENKRDMSLLLRSVGKGKEDHFLAKYRGGNLEVEASNPLAAAFVTSMIKKCAQVGSLQECLGECRASYPLRPLWITSSRHVALSDKVGAYLPDYLLDKDRPCIDMFCKRVIELGFNTVIFGAKGIAFSPKPKVCHSNIEPLIQSFHSYGIKVVIKPVVYFDPEKEKFPFSPYSEEFQKKVSSSVEELFTLAPDLDKILWESHYCSSDFLHHPCGKEWTKQDKTLKEMQLVEAAMPKNAELIFYLPADEEMRAQEQKPWLLSLIDDAAVSTTLSFTLRCGSMSSDAGPLHPLWDQLQRRPDISSTRLLPILNVGGVELGDGLWPNIPLDQLEDFYCRASRHHFAGFITLIPSIPKKGGLLECALFAAGQLLWRRVQPSLSAETWLKASLPEASTEEALEMFRLSRQVIKKLGIFRAFGNDSFRSRWSPDQCKVMVESALGMLKEIEYKMVQHGKSPLKNYFNFFIRDAKRIVAYGLQCSGLPVPPLGEDSGKESFWTAVPQGDSEGMRSSTKVSLLKSPDIGDVGSARHKLYWESRVEV